VWPESNSDVPGTLRRSSGITRTEERSRRPLSRFRRQLRALFSTTKSSPEPGGQHPRHVGLRPPHRIPLVPADPGAPGVFELFNVPFGRLVAGSTSESLASQTVPTRSAPASRSLPAPCTPPRPRPEATAQTSSTPSGQPVGCVRRSDQSGCTDGQGQALAVDVDNYRSHGAVLVSVAEDRVQPAEDGGLLLPRPRPVCVPMRTSQVCPDRRSSPGAAVHLGCTTLRSEKLGADVYPTSTSCGGCSRCRRRW